MLKLKEKQQLDIDSPETTVLHGEIIRKKPFLRKLYEEWYGFLLHQLDTLPEGKVVELGSGGGFLKDLYPEVVTSDVLDLPNTDMTFSAEKMPFDDNSLSAIFMVDVLHHIPKCEEFFKEAERTLNKGGKIIMVEPANTPFGRFFYKRFHHEPFDENANWDIPSTGPLSGANIALPWIVFKRDIDLFHEKYPNLQLRLFDYHTPFRYILSGGVSYKSVIPGWGFEATSFLERLLKPFYSYLAMFQTIEVIKK